MCIKMFLKIIYRSISGAKTGLLDPTVSCRIEPSMGKLWIHKLFNKFYACLHPFLYIYTPNYTLWASPFHLLFYLIYIYIMRDRPLPHACRHRSHASDDRPSANRLRSDRNSTAVRLALNFGWIVIGIQSIWDQNSIGLHRILIKLWSE